MASDPKELAARLRRHEVTKRHPKGGVDVAVHPDCAEAADMLSALAAERDAAINGPQEYAESNRQQVDQYHQLKGLKRDEYYRYYLDPALNWPADHGTWFVCACLQDNGVNAWPGDGTGIVDGLIYQQNQRAQKAEAERDAAWVLLERWTHVPEVTEIDPEDRDPETERLWRETRALSLPTREGGGCLSERIANHLRGRVASYAREPASFASAASVRIVTD